MPPKTLLLSTLLVLVSLELAHADQPLLDVLLRNQIRLQRIEPIQSPPPANADQVTLGRMLFYDRILGGNRDTSCATCHHDFFVTGDALSLSIGTKGTGLGPTRIKGADRPFVPRNAPQIFNLGVAGIRRQFWDGRVELVGDGSFHSPAGAQLPTGFTNVLQIQAMFPVTGRDEMRGVAGDLDIHGQHNELAVIADTDFTSIWSGLMSRLLGPDGGMNPNLPSYSELFARAFPTVAKKDLGFQHAAMAIAAFEAETYLTIDTPWDQYVAGNNKAINDSAKRGALVFFGPGGCAKCHSGALFTDQEHHNLLIPQLGPGKAPYLPDDVGREDVTRSAQDQYKFRTPALRNVAATGPYMHNGAFATLESAVMHHLNPSVSFLLYNRSQLNEPALRPTVKNSAQDLVAHSKTTDYMFVMPTILTPLQFSDLLNFLQSLTSPSLSKLPSLVPTEVPSGLPVDGID